MKQGFVISESGFAFINVIRFCCLLSVVIASLQIQGKSLFQRAELCWFLCSYVFEFCSTRIGTSPHNRRNPSNWEWMDGRFCI
uniref:Uncharacterized protein n=1 Tax=Cucumis melo TaxID=3656 RepID=A0A9I9CN52_CUCME